MTSLFIKYMYLDIVTVIIFQQVMGPFFGTFSFDFSRCCTGGSGGGSLEFKQGDKRRKRGRERKGERGGEGDTHRERERERERDT